jgi:hypothetical protein
MTDQPAPVDPFDPRAELRAIAAQLLELTHSEVAVGKGDRIAARLEAIAAELPPPPTRVPFEPVPGDPIPRTLNTSELADHVTLRTALPAELPGLGILSFEFGQGRDGLIVPVSDVPYIAPPAGLRDLARMVNTGATQLARLVEGR